MKLPCLRLKNRTPSRGRPLRTLLLSLLLGNIVGVLLMLLDRYDSAITSLVLVNAVSLCIWASVRAVRIVTRGHVGPVTALLLAGPAGLLLGSQVTGLIGFDNPVAQWLVDPWHQWRGIVTSLVFTVAAGTFILRDLAASEYRAGLDAHRRQAAEARQAEALARLALLQAQIEPHFLFNTLANVRSMLDRDPRTAGQMLDLLNRYLRASLGRTRAPMSTCAEEIDLVEALLGIAAIRLGERLRYEIRLPDTLREAHLPPLLLQPLVENALKHGIEPAVDGGRIEVECTAHLGRLHLRVRDTGVGFQEAAPAGVGLSNIRARLASLYGSEGQLALHHNTPRGTVAEVSMPLT